MAVTIWAKRWWLCDQSRKQRLLTRLLTNFGPNPRTDQSVRPHVTMILIDYRGQIIELGQYPSPILRLPHHCNVCESRHRCNVCGSRHHCNVCNCHIIIWCSNFLWGGKIFRNQVQFTHGPVSLTKGHLLDPVRKVEVTTTKASSLCTPLWIHQLQNEGGSPSCLTSHHAQAWGMRIANTSHAWWTQSHKIHTDYSLP